MVHVGLFSLCLLASFTNCYVSGGVIKECETYTTDLEWMKARLIDLERKSSKIDMLEREIEELKKERNTKSSTRSRRLLIGKTTTSIAFYTHISHLANENLNQVIIYDSVTTNIGNAYNNHSGIFRAPVSGVYHFTSTVMTMPGSAIHVQIVKNGAAIGWNYAATESYESGSTSLIVELRAGDDVWVKDVEAGTKTLHPYYNNFCGFLMFQTE